MEKEMTRVKRIRMYQGALRNKVCPFLHIVLFVKSTERCE